jgi:RimJ/RimL family protein N-acetyltransferase
MDVKEVFAIVDKSNIGAIKLLEYFEFELKEVEKGRQRYVYSLKLIF